MKKQIMGCMALAVVLLLAGCGNTDPDPSASESGPQNPPAVSSSSETPDLNDEVSSSPSNADALTLEDVLAAPASDAADFTWRDAEDGSGVYLSGCTSDDDILVVPDEVDGKPVIGVNAMAVNMLDCRALVLPDSMKTMADGSIGLLDKLEILVFGAGLEKGLGTPTTAYPELRILYVKDGAQYIPNVLTAGSEKLEKVYLPSSLKEESFDDVLVILASGTPTIVAESGSAAEQYAQDNGYPCENP